jgi:RNA polymerase sigma factor FliA
MPSLRRTQDGGHHSTSSNRLGCADDVPLLREEDERISGVAISSTRRRIRTRGGAVERRTTAVGHFAQVKYGWRRDRIVFRATDLENRLRELITSARRIARRFRRNHGTIESGDLVQCGLLACLESDRTKASARPCVSEADLTHMRSGMIACLRAEDSLSRGLRHDVRRSARCILGLQQLLYREPTNREIAASMDLTLAQYQQVVCDYRAHRKMRGDPSEAIENIAASNEGPLQVLLSACTRNSLHRAIESLPLRERAIIRMHYRDGWNLNAIGASLSISESRVSQLLTHIKASLHRQMEL